MTGPKGNSDFYEGLGETKLTVSQKWVTLRISELKHGLTLKAVNNQEFNLEKFILQKILKIIFTNCNLK